MAWEQTSAVCKGSTTKSEWEVLGKVREVYGAVVSRKLLSLTVTKKLAGTPDGEYVVLRFKTEFANKKNITETVTQQKEADGLWRTAGYFINQ